MDIGSAVGRQIGVADEKLRALTAYESDPALDNIERAALKYAVHMTEQPVHVPQEVFDELKKQFDDRQIVELTSCIAWENYRARFDHALEIEAEGFSEGAYCPMPVSST